MIWIRKDGGCDFSQTDREGLSTEVLSKNQNEMKDIHTDTWERNIPGREKSKCKSPEAEECLAYSRSRKAERAAEEQ